MPSCHHAIMPSCHHAIMPSCHHAIMPSCHHAIMPSCHHAIMPSCHHAIMPSCHHAIMPSCHHAIMPSCHHAIMPSCHHAIMPSCHHAIMPSCHHAIMPSCHLGGNPQVMDSESLAPPPWYYRLIMGFVSKLSVFFSDHTSCVILGVVDSNAVLTNWSLVAFYHLFIYCSFVCWVQCRQVPHLRPASPIGDTPAM